MFLIEWIYKLLFGEDAGEDLKPPPPKRKRK
jgi:hypothetical protein